jgi:hypothetical protein
MLRFALLAVVVIGQVSLSTGCCCCTDFMKGFRQGFDAELKRQQELDRLELAELERQRAEEERKAAEERQKIADLEKKKGDNLADPFKDQNPDDEPKMPKLGKQRHTFSQSTGEIKQGDKLLGVGYSGIGAARNNPAMQAQANGPIPLGEYRITQRTKDARIKRDALRLLPAGNVHLGRFPKEVFAIIYEPEPPNPAGALIVVPRAVWDAIAPNSYLEVVP